MLLPLVKGAATYIPGLYRPGRGATGGTITARYCYSVWLRHLCTMHEAGLQTDFDVVAELGPGDSQGLGLSALLCGARAYYALDIVPYAHNQRNLQILHELVELFRRREPIPDEVEYPEVKPRLSDYAFPHDLLSGQRLEETLTPGRIASIEAALRSPGSGGNGSISIVYCAPWTDDDIVREASVDLIFSQAALEHIDDLDGTYQSMHRWLKPDGLMSHEIDFRAHHLDRRWNAHWTYSDLTWRIIRGRRPYLLNRQPLSTHLSCLERHGFQIVFQKKHTQPSAVRRDRLAARFRNLSEDDLTTSGVSLLAFRWDGP